MICSAIQHPTDRALLEDYAVTAAGLSVYVLDTDIIAPASWVHTDAYGLAGPRLASAFEASLRASGDWRAVGPAVWINEAAIIAEATRAVMDDGDLRNEISTAWVLAVFAHELAHVACHGELPTLNVELVPYVAELVRCAVESPEGPPPMVVPWFGHGIRWIRAAIHMWHRIQLLSGIVVPLCRVADLSRYGLSTIHVYHTELMNEEESRAGEHIDDILDSDPPAGFVNLWRDDVGRYVRSLTNDDKQRFLEDLSWTI